MPTLNLTTQQVAELVRQLPPRQQRDVLLSLASASAAGRERRAQVAERRLRQIASDRGMNWDAMSDEQRLDLVDDLVHEDRECR